MIFPPDKYAALGFRVRKLCGLVMLMLCFATFMRPAQGMAAMPITASAIMADQIVVYKSKHLLYLLNSGRILKKYSISLGRNPVGHKMEWGDMRTPEGHYTIDMKNPDSHYYRSLRISYPDPTDADVAAALSTNPGDWIMIHGMPNGRDLSKMHKPYGDWTNGCIAVSNTDMDDIWRMVDVGTKISIWP